MCGSCGPSNICVTDKTTNQPTDTASYRGALAHLKRMKEGKECRNNNNLGTFKSDLAGSTVPQRKASLRNVERGKAMYHTTKKKDALLND